ncbi:Fimbrial protein [compost metagenome]
MVYGPSASDSQITCTSDDVTTDFTVPALWGNGTGNLYPTSLPGVGYKIIAQSPNFGPNYFPFNRITHVNGTTDPLAGVNFYIQFIRTSPDPINGSTVGGAFGRIYVKGGGIEVRAWDLDLMPMTFRMVRPTCTHPASVTVDMGTHLAGEMPNIGNATAPKTFSIPLEKCPSNTWKIIRYRIDATGDLLAPSVVALIGSGAERGFGLQLLDDSGAVYTPGTWKDISNYDMSFGGSYNIDMQARYYRTGSPIIPGVADATMTFTIDYQ